MDILYMDKTCAVLYLRLWSGGIKMFYDLVKSRRSIRKFQSKEVEKGKIDIILKSALLSPSSRSRRPWEFIAVTDKDLLKKLSMCREHSSSFLADAPLGIVVIADPEACDVWIEDASIASIIIQLAAQSLGLGSCWIQVRERYGAGNVKAGDYIKDILDIPAKYEVECMIAIGYSAEDKKPYDENQLAYDKIHYDKY
jgi:nitroreductase